LGRGLKAHPEAPPGNLIIFCVLEAPPSTMTGALENQTFQGGTKEAVPS